MKFRRFNACAAFAVVLFAFVAHTLYSPLPTLPVDVDLSGKTYVVTGATINSIGYEVASALVDRNADVVLGMRNAERGAASVFALKQRGVSSSTISMEQLDLVDLESAIDFAKTLKRKFPNGVDGIVLNAGILAPECVLTRDGLEKTFQVNHLGHFAIVHELLKSDDFFANDVKVAWVSSGLHLLFGTLDRTLEQVSSCDDTYTDGMKRYSDTKLLNVLTASAMQRRLPPNARSFSVAPGLVRSNFHASANIDSPSPWFSRTPEEGARRIVHGLLVADAVMPGAHVEGYSRLIAHSARTTENEEEIWRRSEAMMTRRRTT